MQSNDDSGYRNTDSKEAVIRKISRIPIWKSRSRSYPGDVLPHKSSKVWLNNVNSSKSTDESQSNIVGEFQGTEEANSFITSQRGIEFADYIQGNVWSPKLHQLKEATTKSIRTIRRVKFFPEDLQHIEDEILSRKEFDIENETVTVFSHNETNSLVELEPSLKKYTTVAQEVRTVKRIRSFVDLLKKGVSTLSLTPPSIFRKSSASDITYNVLENTLAKDETRSGENSKNTHEYVTLRDEKNMQQAHAENRHYQNEDATHFIAMLHRARRDLQEKCGKWNAVLQGPATPALSGEIRSVIGQARLLISERFQQFEGLVHKFVNPLPGDKPILKTDLEGFWEMISYQIKDVIAKFENLEQYKERRRSSTRNPANKGREERAVRVAGVSKTTAYVNTAGAKSSKHYKEDAKKRLIEAKNAMKDRISQREKQGEESQNILNETQTE